jgi:hypothetical protein
VWPYSISVGLGGKAIAIGTDDSDIVASLEPWRILDVGGPTDYCLELHPEAPVGAKSRPLPGLYHGSKTVLRSRDRARLTSAFQRILGSHARAAGPGQLRIGLMPVSADGAAILVPPASIAPVPDRWFLSQGLDALHTVSSLVDVGRGEILLDPPLGIDAERETRRLAGWWLPPSPYDGPPSPGLAVAEAMRLASDVTIDTAAPVLQAVAALVERFRPVIAPADPAAVKELLTRIKLQPRT